MLRRVRELVAAVSSESPERERLARAIKACGRRAEALRARSAAVATCQEPLDAVELATNRERRAENAIKRAAEEPSNRGGGGAALITLHAELTQARDALAAALAGAQGAAEALDAARLAEEDARSALADAEHERDLARRAVLLAEFVTPEIERFTRASEERNQALAALHALAFAFWPKRKDGRYTDTEIYGAITAAIQAHSPQFPTHDALVLHSLPGQTRLADEVREGARAWAEFAQRLAADAKASR